MVNKTAFASTVLSTAAATSAASFAKDDSSSKFDLNANNNIALYYGQNSAAGGDTQKRLKEYCGTDAASDVILLSFMMVFPNDPQVNFGPACTSGKMVPGTQMLQCPEMAEDIKVCQKNGKKVILSLGGASGSYSLANDEEGSKFGDTLWDLFGNSGTNATSRPFQDAILDGYDLDIEGGATDGYPAMVDKLREHFDKDDSREYLITAAPQCPTNPPDVITSTIEKSHIDHLYVQFYNNACGIDTYKKGEKTAFNFEEWDNLVKTKSKNKDAKVFLGVPAAQSAAGKGYVPVDTVIEAANEMQEKYCSFGGVMAWDMSQAYNNEADGKNFADAVKEGISGKKQKTDCDKEPTSSAAASAASTVAATSPPTQSTQPAAQPQPQQPTQPAQEQPTQQCQCPPSAAQPSQAQPQAPEQAQSTSTTGGGSISGNNLAQVNGAAQTGAGALAIAAAAAALF